jgi:hypothetical protein
VAAFKAGPLEDLKGAVRRDERVLFLPMSNDFAATTMVPFTLGSSYNTGVDKNFSYASEHWPDSVLYARNEYDTPLERDLVASTLDADADVVVFPGFDLREAALDWVPALDQRATLDVRELAYDADVRFEIERTEWYLLVRTAVPVAVTIDDAD